MSARHCAICDKRISKKDICNNCFKIWCLDKAGNIIQEFNPRRGKVCQYPLWVQEMISSEKHIQRYVEPRELANSDLSNDELDYMEEALMAGDEFDGVISGRAGKVQRCKGAE